MQHVADAVLQLANGKASWRRATFAPSCASRSVIVVRGRRINTELLVTTPKPRLVVSPVFYGPSGATKKAYANRTQFARVALIKRARNLTVRKS
jgi:hypothetical protein